ncbi:MAG: protein-glutamate O-methyltransferase CheR [Thermoplasmatota archaeon]|nr:protein-glutamate O-methyltransferase CheR [Candidatus Thermoplasmatota archaeon]MBU1915438.1 protein-glutamate O-methyltransferase CheR [Candidatus Thermoplasmatota archaeon]
METDDSQVVTEVMRHLFRSRGIDMSGYSPSFMMRSIKRRIGRSGCANHSTYLRLLLRSEEETNELLGALSINVTEFFRDKGAFEAWSAKVLLPLVSSKSASGGLLRIWSAGCASGQETYTLSICVNEALKKCTLGRIPMVTILGTDISVKALAKAKSGSYTKEEVRGVPEKYLAEYFQKHGNAYEVGESLRKVVRFTRENLLDTPSSKYFDAVVCRNVMIYFSRAMHEQVVMNLYHALSRDGYLMLGKTETLMGAPRDSFEVVDLEHRILKKKVHPVGGAKA